MTASTGSAVLNIPRDALIRDGNRERVVVALGNGQFTVRQVAAGKEIGDRVEISSGLAAGENVVTSAQFLIDSEASLQTGLDRMQAPAEPPAQATSADQSSDPHQHDHM
jgi:Cu(I)/Ag(I) efflux system membrane fusion protein